MEILIGLAVATALVLGCFSGNLFICTFLTLGLGLLTAGAALIDHSNAGIWMFAGLCAIGIVWVPRAIRGQVRRGEL